MFLTESSGRTEALGILAHEIGHIVHALGLPAGGISRDGGFVEGFATWAAGRNWTDMLGFDSFAEAVASYRAAGTYLPLATYPVEAFPAADDTAATRMPPIATPPPPPQGGRSGALDDERVYGATLETLEADWLRAMAGREDGVSAPAQASRRAQ